MGTFFSCSSGSESSSTTATPRWCDLGTVKDDYSNNNNNIIIIIIIVSCQCNSNDILIYMMCYLQQYAQCDRFFNSSDSCLPLLSDCNNAHICCNLNDRKLIPSFNIL